MKEAYRIISEICAMLRLDGFHHADVRLVEAYRGKHTLVTVYPLRYGKASFWIYADGTIGSEKREAGMLMSDMDSGLLANADTAGGMDEAYARAVDEAKARTGKFLSQDTKYVRAEQYLASEDRLSTLATGMPYTVVSKDFR